MCGGDLIDDNQEEMVHLAQKHQQKYPSPGLNKKRKCRDIFCLLLLFVAWGGNFVIAYFALTSGDPLLFLYGDDSDGNVCGKNNTLNQAIIDGLAPRNITPSDYTDMPYQYFLTAFQASLDVADLPRICVSECPTETSLEQNQLICLPGYERDYQLVVEGRCFFPYASVPVLNRCVPTVVPENVTSLAMEELNGADLVTDMVASVYDTWYIIVGSGVFAVIFGFMWLILMRFLSGVAIWTNVISSVFFILGLAFMMWTVSGQLEQTYLNRTEAERLEIDVNNYLFLRYTSYGLTVLGGLFALFTLLNSCNIQLAIAIAQEASKAFVSMPLLIVFPFFPFFWFLCVITFFVIVGLFIYSATVGSGVWDENGYFQGYDPENTLKIMGGLHIFIFLWTANFILAYNQTIVSGAIADWYYSYRGKKLKKSPIWRSLKRTTFYSLGSLAFGSLIIAIVQFVRIFLKYIKSQLQGKDNQCTECLFNACDCLLACFERFIEYINKNAYVMIAMYGYPFCVSAKRGFSIVLSNPLKAGTIQCISNFTLLQGKVAITMIVTGGAFIFLSASALTRYWAVPLIIIAIVAFTVSSMFMSIYDTAINTILFCFLEDTFVNDGSRKQPYHCSKTLYALVDKNGFGPCCCCC